jgi:type I restriction enzyme S subunit
MIASILGRLDDKIELNQQMNKTLEAIGKTIFQQWFIDFEFPNEEGKPYKSSGGKMVDSEHGPIPENWKVTTLPSIASVIDCLHAKKPERCDSNFLLLQVYNINVDYGIIDLTEKYTVSDSNYKTWTKNIEVSTGDCIITNAGIVGAIAQIPVDFTAGIGRNITAIRPEHVPPTYLFRYLRSSYGKKEIERNTDRGTIFDSLNVKGIRKMLIPIPPKEILTHFESVCRPLRESVERNILGNSSLKDIQDLLLPKLMSGKIRVPM